MATTDSSFFDALFFVLALIAVVVLVSIMALAIIGGIVTGAVAGGTLGTPGLIISFGASVLLVVSASGLVLDQNKY